MALVSYSIFSSWIIDRRTRVLWVQSMKVAYARWAEGIFAVTLACFHLQIMEVNISPFGHANGAIWQYVPWVAAPVSLIVGGLAGRLRVVRILGWVWLIALYVFYG